MEKRLRQMITKIIALTTMVVMSASIIGCSAKYPKGAPTLSDEQEMFVGAYCAPDPTEEQYKWAAECGITDMFVGGGDYWGYFPLDTPEYYELPYIYGEKYGVDIVMHVPDTSYTVMSEMFEEIKDRENFAGFLVADEPSAKRFDYYARDYKKYAKDFPNKPYYINLLPIYADDNQLGKVSYEEHLRLYKEKLLANYDANHRVLMCDCYPLMNGQQTYEKWLYNLELLRDTADSVNAKLYLFLQAQGFLGQWRQPSLASELTYQMYVTMAYGVNGFAYYPYKMPESSPENQKAIIDVEGNKTYMYELAKSANDELKKLDGVYMGFDWKGVINKAGTRNPHGTNLNFSFCKNTIENYGVLKEVSSRYDCIVGCFENADTYQGYMVVNFNDPLSGKENEVTLSFAKKIDKAIVYVDGEPEVKDVVGGELTVSVGIGEGVFVVPYNE